MKNIQVIDSAISCVYDVFSVTYEEFEIIFPDDTDTAFINEVYERGDQQVLDAVFDSIWKRRIKKVDVLGVHGVLFYGFDEKKQFYPTRKDEEATNPNGSKLRNFITPSAT